MPFEARVELGGIAATIERVARELGSVATKVLKLVDVPVTIARSLPLRCCGAPSE